MNDEPKMDFARAERDVVAAAKHLVGRHLAIRTIVLACTTMPKYQSAIEAATGRPTVDLIRLLTRGS